MQVFTMWSRNDKSDWLDNITIEVRDERLDKARTLAPRLKPKFDERKIALISAKKERL